ncbi:RING finger and CHY zinc finger domain-containing protein 1 [Stylophora pistillata]|uniref:RING finger and CHY zinc finger domain-containing protein 1 n=1 Tax=Stylophora pistillata TaxID=50429 RepID=A0A2B4R5C9_STYPI|nr:RING finger and CHY zinc finger domain-containing protein 1 [Stylophora pistillata]
MPLLAYRSILQIVLENGKEKWSIMEIHEEHGSCKSESFCQHFERNTCLIHFACCDEKDWYPCHKCHNDAVNVKRQEINKTSGNNSENYDMGRNGSEELDSLEEGRPNMAETCSEAGGAQVDALNDDEVGATAMTSEAPGKPTTANQDLHTKNDTHLSPLGNEMENAVDGECGQVHEIPKLLKDVQFCQKCENESCGNTFSSYFCPECKLLIETTGNAKLDPYHCGPCGVCRSNKEENFHCDKCNVCMPLSLRDHKCFDNRGHDPCAICWEEVFSGAVILPCFHMIHKDCAVKLVLSGSGACPMCRCTIMQKEEVAKTVIQETGQASNPFKRLLCSAGSVIYRGFRGFREIMGTRPPVNHMEMNNVSQ